MTVVMGPSNNVARLQTLPARTEALPPGECDHSVRVSKKDRRCYAYIVLQIPPAALELLDDGGRDLSVIPLRPQAGTGQLECKVMLAIRDEIGRQSPPPASSQHLSPASGVRRLTIFKGINSPRDNHGPSHYHIKLCSSRRRRKL